MPPAPSEERAEGDDERTGEADEGHEGESLEDLLVARGIAVPEQIVASLRIQKQAPGRHYIEILREQGINERAAQAVIAELARIQSRVLGA